MIKNKIKTILLIVLMFVIFMFPNQANAETLLGVSTSSSGQYFGNYDYVINDYKIDMVVNEDNTFNITETIIAYFNVPKHGIFRKIPLRNSITRLDGSNSNNIAKISDIYVNNDFTTYNEDGYKVIKIGDANTTVKGLKIYTIKYNYNIGKDPLKDVDELYFNLIGDEWDTTISNISFKIEMPKPFDNSLLGFSSGKAGSTNSANVNYNVNGRVIEGKVNKVLQPREALTVRLTLPDGYFVGENLALDKYSIFVVGLCITFVISAYIIWKKYGKDEQVIETVEFYPPEGYNSAEVGFLYNGISNDEGIISLLIYLANKGYLKIEETDDRKVFLKSKDFRIIKLKEYDGNNECERIFLDGLFKGEPKTIASIEKAREIMNEAKLNGEKISFVKALEMTREVINNSNRTTVTESDLYNSFYKTLNRIKSKMNSTENHNKIFETAGKGKKKWFILMIITVFILITLKPMLEYGQLEMLPFALIFPGIGFTVLISMVFGKTNSTVYVNGVPTKSKIATKLFGLIWGGMFGGVP